VIQIKDALMSGSVPREAFGSAVAHRADTVAHEDLTRLVRVAVIVKLRRQLSLNRSAAETPAATLPQDVPYTSKYRTFH
jgi:hypothetical protein